MFAIGVDIGGMSIKAGLVSSDGKIICENRTKTASSAELCIKNLYAQIQALLDSNNLTTADILGIGVGCPGAVNSKLGVVEYLPNLGWENIPLAKLLSDKFSTKALLGNDANVATLGEAIFGCAKGYDDVIMFTIGTGVGGGIIINKKIYEGGYSKGGELGHITLVVNGKPCTCGRNGCIETYVSATALISQTKEAMLQDSKSKMWDIVSGDITRVDGKTAFDCENFDASAKKVVDTYICYLSESVLNMLNIFRPQVFIIGGGISAQGDNLTSRVYNYCKKFSFGYKGAPETKIVTATLGNGAGIIGAASLLFE